VSIGCAGTRADAELPEATIGASQEAEIGFRPLMRAWSLGTDKQRQDLGPSLEGFIAKHPDDPLVRLALVLRAFNALDAGELDRARDLAQGEHRSASLSPLFGPAGTPRDLANLVIGAVERREGRHREASRRLEPLVNKLLDSFATARLNEELVLAALGAKRWAAAIRFMDVWQSQAAPGQERDVEDRVKELLAQVPKGELLADLRRRSTASESGIDMAKLVAQQLAMYAVWDRDSTLARLLVDEYGPLLGRYGEAAARLAVDTTRGRVLPNTVGVLLALDRAGLRRRSTDVVAGMSLGMGLPGSTARLVTRDAGPDPDQVRRALAELAGEGAAVVIAGLDARHSAEAAGYARDNSLPIVLVTPDPAATWQTSPFVFELGQDPATTTGLLVTTLRGVGHDRIAAIGEPGSAEPLADLAGSFDCQPLPSATALGGLGGLVVRDGAHCGDDLWSIARSARVSLAIGLGPADLGELPATVSVLATGIFPVRRNDARLSGWFATRPAPPSWWAALGHDAAVLALEAVRDLQTTDTNVEEVRARRLEATSALTIARGALWSTEAKGFEGQQRMAREIRVLRGRDGR
jgi:hypothetical protein